MTLSFFLAVPHSHPQLSDSSAPQTLPEICSEQDEMDFLMEALIMRYSSTHSVIEHSGSTHILRKQLLILCQDTDALGGA